MPLKILTIVGARPQFVKAAVVSRAIADLNATESAPLIAEGITQGVEHVGDVMYDAALMFGDIAEARSTILSDLGLTPGAYALATVHRAENTDDGERLRGILTAFAALTAQHPVVLPLHPRTKGRVDELGLSDLLKPLTILPPVSFLDMICLEKGAKVILTDSGGVQKEAYFHGVPCVTLRDETEWVETVESGWNQVAGADSGHILKGAESARGGRPISDYGTGTSARTIVDQLSG